MSSLLDELASSGATYNRRHAAELMDLAGLTLAADTLPGAVVVVRETESEKALGLVLLSWASGAVPLLAPVPPRDRRQWVGGSGSHVIEGAVAEWGLPDGCALLQETSGSTGRAKIVMRGSESLRWERLAYRELLGSPANSLVHNVRLEQSLGIGLTLAAMLDGRSVLHAEPERSGRIIDAATESCVLGGTPSTLLVLIRNWSRSDIRPGAVFCGAGRLAPEIVAGRDRLWPEARIVTGFGSTETGGVLGGDESGELLPVGGVEVLSPGRGEMALLGVRMPHRVLGYLGDVPSARAGDEWEFSDLFNEQSYGRYRHVGRVSQSLRLREQYRHFADLAGLLREAERNWTFAEFDSKRGIREHSLVIEGAPMTPDQFALISSLAKSIDDSISVRTIAKLPTTDLGKVRWDALIQLLDERDGEEAVI
ncbi:hypothetical protein Cs7R123_63370 [Catellatospora sp. TT07R-123]|uniref:AMP-binding protein n=1 Tax=Catellatospora sp. TT07R-123 TaxID=2733863 RepID=UPI001AFF6D92|nr:AMP-binding protein [Catellatospora sp. TT07R-123]GHJ48995.1 hypothetical protein Cs7R123_63370 [Catellatospora sp. TT07R-123]